jgi:hypothetical protein
MAAVQPGTPAGPDLPLPPLFLRALGRALRSIRYGSIELVIHEGRVVQLELREKVRAETEVTQRSEALDRGAGTEAGVAPGLT